MTVFSFSDYNGDSEDEELPYDEYLTVKAFLEMHFGKDTGEAVYKQLERRARHSTKEVGGLPGLIFNEEGGEFVSFSTDPMQEDEFGSFDDDAL
jgi:hypothetical protein